MLDGMNEHGLTVTYNLAYTLDEPKCYVPLSLALQEMLETCKTADEAARFITQAKRGGHDAVLTLADAEGNIRTVEITSNHFATSNAAEVKRLIQITTNQMRCRGMRYHVLLSVLAGAHRKNLLVSEFMSPVSRD
jgi:predicted choloylglycine hydrolase